MTSVIIPYTPILVTSKIQDNIYSFTIYDDQWKLLNHVCKHVLDPSEGWVQLDPTFNLSATRSSLPAADCYSHYLGSPHNFECKWCPHLGSDDCNDLIMHAREVYTSSISRIIQQQSSPLYCYCDGKGSLIFVDEFGIMLFCEPTSTANDYTVVSAYRHQINRSSTASKKQYFDQARKKLFDKYAMGGKFVILRK